MQKKTNCAPLTKKSTGALLGSWKDTGYPIQGSKVSSVTMSSIHVLYCSPYYYYIASCVTLFHFLISTNAPFLSLHYWKTSLLPCKVADSCHKRSRVSLWISVWLCDLPFLMTKSSLPGNTLWKCPLLLPSAASLCSSVGLTATFPLTHSAVISVMIPQTGCRE